MNYRNKQPAKILTTSRPNTAFVMMSMNSEGVVFHHLECGANNLNKAESPWDLDMSILKDGCYHPPMRHAPAACCSFVSRIQVLRKMHKNGEDITRLLNEPLAFESEFLSGDIEKVHNAILKL